MPHWMFTGISVRCGNSLATVVAYLYSTSFLDHLQYSIALLFILSEIMIFVSFAMRPPAPTARVVQCSGVNR